MQNVSTALYDILLAPNASLLTGPGTNTIIVGSGEEGATVIDPAVDQQEFLEAIIRAGSLRGGIRRILITHGHPDHQGGAEALRKMLDVHIYAASREGISCTDCLLPDGMTIPAGNERLRVIHTPGHRFDHLCFLLEESGILFAGDMVAGSGTVVIMPPEGDLLDYMASLRRLQALDLREIVPAHGPTISDPQACLREYISHREMRERQILQCLQKEIAGLAIPTLVEQIYRDVDPRLHLAAGQSVLAHLLKLEREGRVRCVEQDRWTLTQ